MVFSQAKGIKLGGVVMINPKLKDDLTDQLCETVLLLRGVEECYQFFEDICTISELKALAQRLEVARMWDCSTGSTRSAVCSCNTLAACVVI